MHRLAYRSLLLALLMPAVGCAASDEIPQGSGNSGTGNSGNSGTGGAGGVGMGGTGNVGMGGTGNVGMGGTGGVMLSGITVNAPAGGVEAQALTSISISWASDTTLPGVDIQLVKGGTVFGDIAINEVDDGAFDWLIPAAVLDGDDYRIRVVESGGSAAGESPTDFSIRNAAFRRTVTIAGAASNETTFAVPVTLTPGNFDYSKSSGSDLRFATDPDRAVGYDIPYWIESWNPGGTSRVWLSAPTVTANGSDSYYMFYGWPAASDLSDFDSVFPITIDTTADGVISGNQDLDALIVNSGHTLTVTGGSVQINARLIIVNGTINGVGAGHPGATGAGTGSGPGGGGSSTSAGAGGGAYGGNGGLGGLDSGDTPGAGGTAYGNVNALAIQMGSGGGGTDSDFGGNGGASVWLQGHVVTVGGIINVNGTDGKMPGGGRGGGGGAGGGILLAGMNVSLTGQLFANGGAGSVGTSSANDDGGGGGGGRIKLISDPAGSVSNVGMTSANGGAGGPNGNQAGGQNGGSGSITTPQVDLGEPTVTMGSEEVPQ